MSEPQDLRPQVAWETATQVVEVLNGTREEGRAEAFVEVLLVIENGFTKFGREHRRLFTRAVGTPGRN